ncbi:MAG: MFS transporter [Bacteroidales bacterium]|nr:MFS transporter [Bacteroidales bacterium]MBN2818968.1 MFS transporter [Bacteroidales bacterium]
MKSQTQKLSVLEKIGYGSGDAAVNVVFSSMVLIISYFYIEVFGLKPTHMGILFLLVRLIDAVTDPLMGLITDKYTSKRWGRFRPYFLFLAVPFGISVFLTFTTPDFDYAGKLIYAYSTYIFMTLVFTSVTIPYISFISVLTNDSQDSLSANGYRLFLAKIAGLAVGSVVPVLSKTLGENDPARGYQLAMGIFAFLSILLFLFCFFTTKERIEHVIDRKPFVEQLKLLFKNSQWKILLYVCFVGTVGYVLRNSVALFYAKYYLGGDEKTGAAFLTTGVIAAILAMPASNFITRYFCKVKLFKWSQIAVGVLSVIMLLLVRPGNMLLAFPFYFVLSFIVDLQAPVFWSAIPEAVDYGHAETGKRVSGLAYGGISFAQKAGAGIAGFALGYLLDIFNYVPKAEVQSNLALWGLALLLTVIPGVFHALMGGMMFRYKITDKYYQGIKAKLNI